MIDVNFDFTMDTDGYWDGFWTETGDFATDRKDPDWYSCDIKGIPQSAMESRVA